MLPVLQTERLRLAPAGSPDLGFLRDLLIDPLVRRHLCDDVVLTPQEVASLLRDSLAHAGRGLGLWILTDKDRRAPIGCIGLQRVSAAAAACWPDFAADVEPVIALRPAVWGQGFALEAVRSAALYAFTELGCSRLAALVDEPNTASHRLLMKAGFIPVGVCEGPKNAMRAYTLKPWAQLQSASARVLTG